MPPETIEQRTTDVMEWGRQICQNMASAIAGLGFDESNIPAIDFNAASFELDTDPYTQKQALQGKWYLDKHRKVGEIIFHVDGSFYAEYDVVQPHPKDKRWFVEAMTAWGNEGNIKTDARLLPMQGV